MALRGLFPWAGSQECLLCKKGPDWLAQFPLSPAGRRACSPGLSEGRGLIPAPHLLQPRVSTCLALSALQSPSGPTLGTGRRHGICSGCDVVLGVVAVRKFGRALQAQLGKSSRIHLASSDVTTVLWSKLCLNFKKRGAAGTASLSLCPVGPMCFAFPAKTIRPAPREQSRSCSSLCFSVEMSNASKIARRGHAFLSMALLFHGCSPLFPEGQHS